MKILAMLRHNYIRHTTKTKCFPSPWWWHSDYDGDDDDDDIGDTVDGDDDAVDVDDDAIDGDDDDDGGVDDDGDDVDDDLHARAGGEGGEEELAEQPEDTKEED